MKIDFTINEYALVWYILFQSDVNDNICNFKEKLWKIYKEQYKSTYKDRVDILIENKDFIPDNDILYNLFFENKDYQKELKNVEKYRIELLKEWDKNSKITTAFYKNIVRKKINNYTIYVVCKESNIIDCSVKNTIVIGIDSKENKFIDYLLKINMAIILTNTKKYDNKEDETLRLAIIELAVMNEYASNLRNKSCFISGSTKLYDLKIKLYPYWLMYIGISQDKLIDRMKTDNIVFDLGEYPYNKDLRKMNIEEFINFCVKNKKNFIK